MSLYEKALGTLELPAVLDMLAAKAVSDPAKEAALSLRPSSNIDEVRRYLAETSAAKDMMATRGGPSFSGVQNVSGSLARADLGGMLNTRELLDIAAVLSSARSTAAYGSGSDSHRTDINYLFSSLKPIKTLEERITTSIIGENELSDSASPELSDIRRHMRIAGDKVRQTLSKIISSPAYGKVLQEPIITMRNDRYVVPVKAEYRSSLPGLVHDISSSGATLFVEPMAAVQANNEIRELLAKEKNEIERILMELSAAAAAKADEIILNFNVLVQLDLIFAKAKLSYDLDCSEPEISSDKRLVLRHARHPLLPKKTAVPIDVRLGGEFDTLVITGPNTGGKTVTLKTIGLLSVMAMCGLHIPAGDGCSVPVYTSVLADIGDEQSIEQSLSTFSSHMKNIVGILDVCDDETLVLFDELGAGTDPVEGAALAVSIIEFARKCGASIAATTHYSELKLYATTTVGVQNASCEFNVETLSPTYRLLIGVPGRSNAFAISERLGLSDLIISDARSRINSEDASVEDMLDSLESIRLNMEKEQEETRRLLIKAQNDSKIAEENRLKTEKALDTAVADSKKQANRIIEDARRMSDQVFDELNAMRKQAAKEGDWQRVNEAKTAVRRQLNDAEKNLADSEPDLPQAKSSRPLRVGDTVKVLSIGTIADVIAISADRVLTLQAGIMKISAKEDEVLLLETPTAKAKKSAPSAKGTQVVPRAAVSSELDIRGMMTDEAIPVVEKYVDSAFMAKLETVTIIHGKGTGALRAAIHTSLRQNRQVKSFRLGRYGEGEAGVTVVELKIK